ncbi:hypothetical protein R4Y45_07095 [Holzapfeliella sp. He02]|uniref:Uncharacterized protein n=1 Tax=Holzapfeliella saturejae TaxID=3082953 RepID=A0ABU8SI33_9LACO
MKRLIPIGINHLCQVLGISVILTLITGYAEIARPSSSADTDIVLIILIGAFNLPNVDLPLQYGITRQSIFKYLGIMLIISSLIYVITIWGITAIFNLPVTLATYPLELSIVNLILVTLAFFTAMLFMMCFYYGQYIFHKLPNSIANFINVIIILLAAIIVVISVSTMNTYYLSSGLISSILALLAVIELVLLYFLVKNVDITVAMRRYGKK